MEKADDETIRLSTSEGSSSVEKVQSSETKSRIMKRPRAGDGLPENADENEPEEKRPTFRLQPPTLIHGKAKPKAVDDEIAGAVDSSTTKCKFLQPPKLNARASVISTTSAVEQKENLAEVNRDSAPAYVSSSNPFLHMVQQVDASHEADSQPETANEVINVSSNQPQDSENKKTTALNGNCSNSSSVPDSTSDNVKLPKDTDVQTDSENIFLTTTGNSESTKSVPEGFLFGRKMEDRVTGNADTKSPEHNAGDNSARVSSSSGFVFGENFADRAKVSPISSVNEKPLFTTQTAEADSSTISIKLSKPAEASSDKKQSLGLEESAAAHFAASQSRTIMPEVEVVTGEENEKNVLQMQCKLYQFEDVSQNWLERGVGILHLNDGKCSDDDVHFQSRLVMRTHGSLRLVLNTKIWSQMTVDKASKKSVRVSAQTGDGKIGVFLITAAINDAEQIHRALEYRILHQKQLEEKRKDLEKNPQYSKNNFDVKSGLSSDTSSDCVVRNDLEKDNSGSANVASCPKQSQVECHSENTDSQAATLCGDPVTTGSSLEAQNGQNSDVAT